MGRFSIITGSMLIVGCTALSDAFKAHSETVAQVQDQELSVDRLAQLFAQGTDIRVGRDVAYELAHHWVNVTAFAKRMAAGDSLLDSALVRNAMWLELMQLNIARFTRDLLSDRRQLSEVAVDSAFRVGEMRMLAHVLRRVGPETSPAERERQRLTAERIRERLMDGGSWESANEQSEDEAAKAANGSLGLVRRGQSVPRFENAAYALRPGGLSEVTETRFGYHIIYRPELDEVRDAFAEWLRQDIAARVDSAYGEELLDARRVKVRRNAAATIREVVADPWRSLESTTVIATFSGGRFTAGEFARWLSYLPDAAVDDLIGAPHSDVASFIRRLVLQELLSRQADSAGVQYGDSLYDLVAAQYRFAVESLWNAVGLEPDSLAAAGATLQDRESEAMRRIDRYFDAILARETELQSVPPSLAIQLRDATEWKILPAGIEQALALADELRTATDSVDPATTDDERESR